MKNPQCRFYTQRTDNASGWVYIHQCGRWQRLKGILLRKPNKPDYSAVEAYRVISLLNCLGKVIEKIAADAIVHYCETTGVLHPGQMSSRKQQNAIDAVACLTQNTHRAWKLQMLVGALLLDVKGAFDHVNLVT
jgi:hypothetical protein